MDVVCQTASNFIEDCDGLGLYVAQLPLVEPLPILLKTATIVLERNC